MNTSPASPAAAREGTTVSARAPDEWREFALAPPRAHGEPLGSARLRGTPEDFVVVEQLGYGADSGAAHVLLEVRKRGRDTLAVARALARLGDAAPRDVGFAGLKDRHALATQWFSVPATRPAAAWQGVAGEGFEVLGAAPHARKLRRGALRGNRFRIVLRGFATEPAALAARLAALAARGVPNYFGPQRFGRDGSNLLAVAQFGASGRLPRGREGRAFVLSAARALVFNAVLAGRVAAASWDALLDGELVNLDGRNSFFAAEVIDATLRDRLARHDLHPTGPLAGRGAPPGGVAGAIEARVLARFAPLTAALATAGLEAARRPLRLVPRELEAWPADGGLALEFSLPAGAYATAVVRELAASHTLAEESDDA
jgi:tRNA pseudouridine13 synthase